MSDTHARSGVPGAKSRPSRSGSVTAVRAGMVVRLGRRRRIPAIWWTLMSRSTRLRFTTRPAARSCAVTLGDP